MSHRMIPLGSLENLEWPQCPYLDSTCLVTDMAVAMGQNIMEAFMTFIRFSEEGSRLILQKNPDGFTVQVTRAVQKTGNDRSIDLAGIQSIRRKLDRLAEQRKQPAEPQSSEEVRFPEPRTNGRSHLDRRYGGP